MVLKWKDRRDVLMLSTKHDNSMINFNRRRTTIKTGNLKYFLNSLLEIYFFFLIILGTKEARKKAKRMKTICRVCGHHFCSECFFIAHKTKKT